MTMIQLRPLAPIHAAEAARLHIVGQPGSFLTSLGPDVLTVLYATLPQSEHGFGYVAVQAAPTSARVDEPDCGHVQAQESVAGFVSATTSVGQLFMDVGARHASRLLLPLAKRYVRQPSLAVRSVQTLLYPFMVADDAPQSDRADTKVVELLSIMVQPAQRGQGTGTRLVEALVAACQARQIGLIDVTVDAGNDGARRFYARHGFAHHKTFNLYGRAMCQYRRPLEYDPGG